jgi:hypothetical protein
MKKDGSKMSTPKKAEVDAGAQRGIIESPRHTEHPGLGNDRHPAQWPEAEVLVVESFNELRTRAATRRAHRALNEPFTNYADTVTLRHGRAAAQAQAPAFTRSWPCWLRTPPPAVHQSTAGDHGRHAGGTSRTRLSARAYAYVCRSKGTTNQTPNLPTWSRNGAARRSRRLAASIRDVGGRIG